MRTTLRLASLAAALVAAPLSLSAQDVRVFTRPDVGERWTVRLDDRPMIGVTTTAESERADTLGLRIEAVTEGSPAAKAGLKAGDRIASVNGISLRADRADAGEEDYSGVLNRRLQREVQKTKEGESVELRVASGGQSRTLRVTPVKGSELEGETTNAMRRGFEMMSERAVLGLTVAATGTLRDTAGVFVREVTRDGPAEKAGIIEGDRIASINGISLRVSREDADDGDVAATRTERLARELAKLKVGEAAELSVVSSGRSRTVRVTTVKASDLNERDGAAFFFGAPDGRGATIRIPQTPMPELREMELKRRMEEMMPRLQQLRHLRPSRATTII